MCNSTRLCDKEDCQIRHDKSFASHEKSIYWSDKNVDKNNKKISPKQVCKNSHKKYWFDCDCGHEFEAGLDKITANGWCPYCSKSPKELCDREDCQSCREKSFASHEKSVFWSDKNKDENGEKIGARKVFKNSHKKYWFNCFDCGHEFESRLSNVTKLGRWCPYCPNQRLCDKDDCQSCREKSFASHEKSIHWSDENVDTNGKKISPGELFKVSGKKYMFICRDCGREFETRLSSVTRMNTWCPFCVNKTEGIVKDFLFKNFVDLECQFKFDTYKYPYDFCIPTSKAIVELDGRQHFEQVSNWNSPEDTRERDVEKMKHALAQGHCIIRILQRDVWDDLIDWRGLLLKAIDVCKKSHKPTVVYICNNNEYELYYDKVETHSHTIIYGDDCPSLTFEE